MTPYRVYTPEECGADGYPRAWHHLTPESPHGLKHLVRLAAGERCVRCQHPYLLDGDPMWSTCDERCVHDGPVRVRTQVGDSLAYQPWQVLEHIDAGGIRTLLQDEHPRVVQAAWRVLTVHHLTGSWGNTSDAKRDCRWWNLAALCQRCHLAIQGKVVMERAFILEHSDWFKPYAAGWYAWKYEGREITRHEAEADQDRLLALERLA